MPTSCSAPGFPKEKERMLKWLLAVGRRSLSGRQHVKLWEPSAHYRICSMHFAEVSCFNCHPSVFSFATTAKQPEQTPARADRFKHLQRRTPVVTPNDKENCLPANGIDEIAEAFLMHRSRTSPIQAELDKQTADYSSMQKDYQLLTCENIDLKEQIKKTNFTYNLGNSMANNTLARASTWSNYKSHNKLYFLIGITPYGSESFLFKCWGGQVSDKEITARSGFYDVIEVSDLVLADRGFLIADELAAHGTSLAIPPFAKEKKGSGMCEKSLAYKLRGQSSVKKIFQILKNTLPISLIRHADSILTICAAFTNLHPKFVK
ncbi:hypothetical protein MAR_036285 [Mya arenaria]|uniref:THAP-type domain-containing protein n=1 Tax=Mya arenaria TaxID=6604 RepID=A0ABY7ES34_MYAAR|nr:hypothetical protein MAR_036285 [Mya arenaria]